MKAFVITLWRDEYSERKADECLASGAKFGIEVLKWRGVNRTIAMETMENEGLKWSWAKNNTVKTICPKTGLQQFPYTAADIRAKIGCSMSHYMLWRFCALSDEPILILEHDAVFVGPIPEDIEFNGICQINDPNGATRKGGWWSQQMKARGTTGAHEKTWVTTVAERLIPDGLAGNSAYMIKPWAAQELVNKFHEIGVWPNDATMCKQLFPYLEEYYPFITKVNQTQSTTME